MSDDGHWDTAEAPRGGRRTPIVLAAVLATVALAWLVGGDGLTSPGPDSGQVTIVRATEPLIVEAGEPLVRRPTPTGAGGWLCRSPFNLAVYDARGRGVAFPAGHPEQPPTGVRPDACFASTQQASEAGYPLAQIPAGDRWIDGVYLRAVGDARRGDCQGAADVLGHPVPCPATVPVDRFATPSTCAPTRPPTPCVVDTVEARGMLLRDPTVTLPPGVGEPRGPGRERPVVFTLSAAAAADPVSPLIGCAPGDRPVTAPLRANLTVTCSAGRTPSRQPLVWTGEQGHPHALRHTQRWRHDGVDVAISLGALGVEVGAARHAIAEDLYWVEPRPEAQRVTRR